MRTADVILAAGGQEHQGLTTSLFLGVILITVGITFWASRSNKTAADYYAGGRAFTGPQKRIRDRR